jgi:hypothetical protein
LGGYGYNTTESDLDKEESTFTSLNELSLYHINLNIATKNNADYRDCLVISCLEHELARIESIRELCKCHDDMLKVIETASRDGKSIQYVTSLESSLQLFYKGFFLYSLPFSSKQRTSIIRKLCASLAAISLSSTSRIYLDTLKFFENMSFSIMDTMKDTSHSLDLLSLQPLEQVNQLPPPEISVTTKTFNNTHYFTSEGFKLVKPSLASQYAAQIQSSVTQAIDTVQSTNVLKTSTSSDNNAIVTNEVVNNITTAFTNIDLNKSEEPPSPPQQEPAKFKMKKHYQYYQT